MTGKVVTMNMKNINGRLDKAERIAKSRYHDRIVLEFKDGATVRVTGGEAVELCRSRDDIVQATGGPTQGLLPQLITALYSGEVETH